MKHLKFTLKAWPVITFVTIGLSFATSLVAKALGIELPDQAQVQIVRNSAGWNRDFANILFTVLVVMPILEEVYFRHFLFQRQLLPLSRKNLVYAALPSAAIMLLAAAAQAGAFGQMVKVYIWSQFPSPAWVMFWVSVLSFCALEYLLRVMVGRLLAVTSPVFIAVAASALFSAAHYLQNPFPDSAFVALFCFGLAQCWLYRKTKSVWYAILNHSLFNGTNLILLFTLPESLLK